MSGGDRPPLTRASFTIMAIVMLGIRSDQPSSRGRFGSCLRELSAACNCTRDEGGPFEFGDQGRISSHRKLLRAKAVVVSVAKRRDKISAGTVERSERKSGPPISYSISTDGSWTRRWREMDSNFPYAVR